MAGLMKKPLHSLLPLLLLGLPLLVSAQHSTSATAPDPIAVATALVLKGQTTAEQRKIIRKHWLTIAAEEVEAVLRTRTFTDIIAFVEQNRDLFGKIYAAMTQARGSMALLRRSREVVLLQGEILLLLGETAGTVGSVQSFTAGEIEQLMTIVGSIMTEVEDDLGLLLGIFDGGFREEFTDADRLALLNAVHARMTGNRAAVLQLQRYLAYLEYNRQPAPVRGAEALFQTAAQ